MRNKFMRGLLATAVMRALTLSAHAAIIVSEADPVSSGNSLVTADWFELTNTGATAVNITGWRMDDNSNSFGVSVALNGVSSIAPGQSVVFAETTATNTVALVQTNFINAWFGGTAPVGFTSCHVFGFASLKRLADGSEQTSMP